jgi:hypothetical protein
MATDSKSVILCCSAEAERILRLTPRALAAAVARGDVPVAGRLHPRNSPLFDLAILERLAGELRFAAIRAGVRE